VAGVPGWTARSKRKSIRSEASGEGEGERGRSEFPARVGIPPAAGCSSCSAVASVIWMKGLSQEDDFPEDAIRDAVFTVSPKTLYRGLPLPITPAQSAPVLRPIRKVVRWPSGRWRLHREKNLLNL